MVKDESWLNLLLIAFSTVILFTNEFRQHYYDVNDDDDDEYCYYKQYDHLVIVIKMNVFQISMRTHTLAYTVVVECVHILHMYRKFLLNMRWEQWRDKNAFNHNACNIEK